MFHVVLLLTLLKVSTEEATRFAKEKQMGFYETSAKLNSNVDEAFGSLVEGLSQSSERVSDEVTRHH